MMKLNIQLFASGTIDGSSTASNADCRIVWTSTPNNEENYSVVTVEAQLYKSGSSSTTGTFSGVVNVNDTEYAISKKFSPYRWGNWVTVGTVSVTIPHNSDGTKSINISTYFSNSGTSMAGSYSTPYPTYVTLDTIPRGSVFNTSIWDTTQRDTPRDMNTSLSFPAIQNVAGVYHKLEARFMNNGTETTICTRTGVTINSGYISFTFSSGELNTVYNLMPNETTHYIRMFLYTYTDSAYQNQLGDVSIIWWTGSIPSSVIPSLSIGTITEGNSTVASLGWDVFVQNKSQLSIPLTGTGAYGSTISSYSTTVNGSTYPGSNVTTNIINTTGSLTISGITTDSRGRSGSASKTVNIVAYSNPQITTAIAARCDSSGNDDDNGTYLKYSFDGSISPISNNNAHTFRIGYKIKGTSAYTYTNIDTTNYSITKSNQVLNLNLDTTKTYTIVFEAIDSFITIFIERQIDTGKDLMNFNESGKAMAIGKVSEAGANQELLEIALPVEIKRDTSITGDVSITGNFTLNSASLLDLIYPVGSIYMSVNNVSPATFLGGTWVALEDRFLIGASSTYSAGSTGGSTTHTLTVDEMPSHSHTIQDRLIVWDTPNLTELNNAIYSGPMKLREANEGLTNTTGGGQAHSIMNPYLAVYMWKRTN